jgi:adenylate cyclase class 2
MTEIELKAHVIDPESTERAIRAIAKPVSDTVKSDVYWKRVSSPEGVLDRPTRFAAAGAILSFSFALIAAITLALGAAKETAIIICLGGCATVALISGIGSFVRGKDAARDKGSYGPDSAQKADASRAKGKEVRLRVRDESGRRVVTYKRKELQGDIEVNDEREFAIDDRAAFEALIGDLGFVPYVTKEKRTKTFAHVAPDGTEVSIELSLVMGLGWFIELEILADDPDEAETSRARETLFAALDRCGVERSAIEKRYYTEMLASLSPKAP